MSKSSLPCSKPSATTDQSKLKQAPKACLKLTKSILAKEIKPQKGKKIGKDK
jgi:hypothetical protein